MAQIKRTKFEAAMLEVLIAADMDPDKVYTEPEILNPLKNIIDVEQKKKPIDEIKVRKFVKHRTTVKEYFAKNATFEPVKQ